MQAWRDSAREGLQAMLDDTDRGEFARLALAAIEQQRELPSGFDYLWYLNASNVFGTFQEGVNREGEDGVSGNAP